MSYKEYREDTKIDKYALDEELAIQSELFMKWAELYYTSTDLKRRLQTRMDLLEGKIGNKIRLDPELYGFDKKAPTEGAIKAIVNQDKEYRKLVKEMHDLTNDMNVYGAAKEAMNHKKESLKSLVKLWSEGYYSMPSITKKEGDKLDKQRKEKINKKLNKRKNNGHN